MIKLIEIETWALRVLEHLETRSRVEDAAVELKAQWIEPVKAARRLAAHANAARGQPLLWLIGADETIGVVGAEDQELSNWFASVKSCFNDEVTPQLTNVSVFFKGKTVAALCFDTTRAPYLVKNPDHGRIRGDAVAWEVPWREGTQTRTATRNDLLLLLSPLRRQPKVEVLSAEVSLTRDTKKTGFALLRFELSLYIIPMEDSNLVFPFHKCGASIHAMGSMLASDIRVDMTPASRKRDSQRIAEVSRSILSIGRNAGSAPQVKVEVGGDVAEATDFDLLLRGPAKVQLRARHELNVERVHAATTFEHVTSLYEAMTDSTILLSGTLSKAEARPNGVEVWRFPEGAVAVPSRGFVVIGD